MPHKDLAARRAYARAYYRRNPRKFVVSAGAYYQANRDKVSRRNNEYQMDEN